MCLETADLQVLSITRFLLWLRAGSFERAFHIGIHVTGTGDIIIVGMAVFLTGALLQIDDAAARVDDPEMANGMKRPCSVGLIARQDTCFLQIIPVNI